MYGSPVPGPRIPLSDEIHELSGSPKMLARLNSRTNLGAQIG